MKNILKNICLAAAAVFAAACTPDQMIPEVKMMSVSISQSNVDQGIKAQWEVGDSVSVFFSGIKTPKYFTITSVSGDKETATISGDYPYGMANGTMVMAVYPHVPISSDISSIPVDLKELRYSNGFLDMSSMVYSAFATYENEQIAPLSFYSETAKVTLDVEPFDGFDPSTLERVDIVSSSLTTSANLNLLAGEGEDRWKLRTNNMLSVIIKEQVASKSVTASGGVLIDLVCIPTMAGQKIDDMKIYLTAGDDMFYAELNEAFEITGNTGISAPKTKMLNKSESGALIFWRKLEEKQLTSGVIRDANGVFRSYYEMDYEARKVKFYSLSKEDFESYKAVAISEQDLILGYYSLDWETPVAGVRGMTYDPSSETITLRTEEGTVATIDSNETAAEDFMAGNGAHYEIKFERDMPTPLYTRGAMSKALWDGAVSQGFMKTIELNSGSNWSFVTMPNDYTSYVVNYTVLAKDRIKAERTGQFNYIGDFEMSVDKDINEEKLADNIFKAYFDSENLFIPAVEQSHVFFVINTKSGEWFKFQPQNEDDLSTVEGLAIERILRVRKFESGVIRQNGEFVAYYSLNLSAATANFYVLNSDKDEIEFIESVPLTKDDRAISWENAVWGITGIRLDDKNNLELSGEASSLTIDNNPTAASEFLDKNAGHHYAIVVDRNTGMFKRGKMSAKFLGMVMEHPTMTSMEVNKEWDWDFVVFPSGPNNFAFYKSVYEIVSRDEVKFTNNGFEEGYNDDESTKAIIQEMLDCFYDTNIVVRQKVGGYKPFYVINKSGKGWFLFERD